MLAADPANPERLLLANRVEKPRFGCDVFASRDGGRTWRRSRGVRTRFERPCYSASVAFVEERAYLFASTLAGPGNHPVEGLLYESRDGGATFGAPRRVLPRSAFQPFMTAGPHGVVVVTAMHANEFSSHINLGVGPPPNPLVVRVSTDGGRTFGPLRTVPGTDGKLAGGPSIVVGSKGELHLAYWDYGDDVFDYHAFPGRYGGRFRLVVATSRDGGRTFDERVVEPAAVPPGAFLVYLPPLPALASDPHTGALYVGWEDGRSGSTDVLLRRSTDGGRSWKRAAVLFSGSTSYRVPALSVHNRRVAATAYQLRRGGKADLVARVSRDGGDTFTHEAALTPSPFDWSLLPSVPGHRGDPDLGSRLGAVVTEDRALAAWSDTRMSVRRIPRADVFYAEVPEGLPDARPLEAAPKAPPPRAARIDRRLRGECASGGRVDSRASHGAVLRSFVSAIDGGELRRAYGYLDQSWKRGGAPANRAHPYGELVRDFGSVSCARLASTMGGGEEGWRTTMTWIAVRRASGPTQLMIGTFWARRNGATWSLMGYWTRDVARRVPGRPGDSSAVRWLAVALDEIASHRVTAPRAARALGLVSVAMDRAAGGGDQAVASAAAAVLGGLFPDGVEEFQALAGGSGTGGRAIGEQVLARAGGDRLAPRGGSLESGRGLWVPTPIGFDRPLEPFAGAWRTWALRSGSEFRPAEPPRPGSPRFTAELRAVYDTTRALIPAQREVAARWAGGAGTATPSGLWNQIALGLIRQAQLPSSRAARILAVLNMAQADAFVACWDAKYAYLSERPVTSIRRELDPDWLPYLVTPPFPAYPSGHSTTSGAASEVLAHFFPAEARRLRELAREAGLSRIYGGIHFPADNEAGLALGRKVARAVLARRG